MNNHNKIKAALKIDNSLSLGEGLRVRRISNFQFLELPIVVLFLLISTSLFAQQAELVPLQFNPTIKQYLREHKGEEQQRLQAAGDTLALPFLNDFSESGIYPDANHWSDKAVFVNADIARNPPTIGVATFDGADALGNAYNSINPSAQGWADTLTSQPIYLHNKPFGTATYTLADSIYLTFFYEKGGYGNKPDNNDSLVLEFYRPSTNVWTRQWSVRGLASAAPADTVFTKVNFPLLDTSYFENGFRFRFRSYGSLSGILNIWHLDYVFLKDYGFPGLSNDILELTYVTRNVSLIQPFSSMPWKHLQGNQSAYVKDSIPVHLRNMSTTFIYNIDFYDKVLNENGTPIFAPPFVSNNVYQNRDSIYQFKLSGLPVLTSPNPDSAVFYSQHELVSTTDFIHANDSLSFRYNFYNYYSYDDGTAELGFDLANAPGGKVAMQFDLAQADSLRAVSMLFAQQNANVSNKLFTLKIWSSLSPETVIYQQQNCKPAYIDSINGMATYVIPPTPVSGTIYIGFQQVAADGLHLGFDRNMNNNSKMFYSISGTWTPFALATGSYMIRAVMGGSNLYLGVNETAQNNTEVFVYPNPVTDAIHFNLGEHSALKNMVLIDAAGRILVNEKINNRSVIDAKNIPNGFYIIQFFDEDYKTFISKKIVVNH